MLGLPQLTETSKQLPKKTIYTKFQMNTAAKEKIDADISRITIVNEIAPNKVNIPSGEDVKSFFVLLVSLKRKEYDEKTISTLSKLIPQNILFVLEYENESRLAIYHTKPIIEGNQNVIEGLNNNYTKLNDLYMLKEKELEDSKQEVAKAKKYNTIMLISTLVSAGIALASLVATVLIAIL